MTIVVKKATIIKVAISENKILGLYFNGISKDKLFQANTIIADEIIKETPKRIIYNFPNSQ